MGEVIMKQPDGKYSTTDGSNMLGGDYHRTINACLLYTSDAADD